MIVHANYGQLSNKLILISHVMGTSIEKNVPLLITDFSDFEKYYEQTVSWGKNVVIKDSIFWHVECRLKAAAKKVCTYLGMKTKSTKIISDWSYRDYANVEIYSEQIRAFFTPCEQYIVDAKKDYNQIDSTKVLVGVHIRRGDYKTWMDGKYFYDDFVYCSAMVQIEKELMAQGKGVCFILFSNEKLKIENYDIESQIVVSRNTAIGDHWLMSKCDYLIGPPSTFSRWAGYMGKVPLLFIEDKNQKVSINDFKYKSI